MDDIGISVVNGVASVLIANDGKFAEKYVVITPIVEITKFWVVISFVVWVSKEEGWWLEGMNDVAVVSSLRVV